MSVDSYLDNEERQRLQSQYAEIATLAGGLAHEVKNPLSTISINLELLAEDVHDDESPGSHRMLHKIELMQRECHRLESLLHAFLQFARLGQIQLVEADLNQVVRDFIDFYQTEANEHGIEISPHLATDLPPVQLDGSLMRQVLLNLALNAQHAIPHGGLLELQTHLRDGRVHLDFIDNGTGIDEEAVGKIFDAFFSTKSGGTGLGLPTVRKIVEAHNGTISCQSEPGRGTRFTISLPPRE